LAAFLFLRWLWLLKALDAPMACTQSQAIFSEPQNLVKYAGYYLVLTAAAVALERAFTTSLVTAGQLDQVVVILA